MMLDTLYSGDCLSWLMTIDPGSIDLVYLDPPFFTQKVQKLKTRDNSQAYYFSDAWTNIEAYKTFLQQRERDKHGKSAYKKDDQGRAILGKEKCGVPLSNVWEIPYLNPKASERTGYPTQKPVLLLEKIIKIATDKGDVVLDPMCGSGTSLVAAALLERHWIGIDTEPKAIEL